MILTNIRNRIKFSTPANITEANIRYLYLEILFAAFLGAITTFNSLFAVRLGASAALIGIMTSAPALIQALTSIPSARYLEGKRDRKTWLLHSLFLMRVSHIGIVLIPFFFPYHPPYTLPAQPNLTHYLSAVQHVPSVTAYWLTAWILLLILPNAFFSNGFNAMLAEIIPERRRAFVFSRRTVIWQLIVTIITMGAGFFLDRSASIFPLNYQLLYLIGVITAMGSQHYLWKLVVAAQTEAVQPTERQTVTRVPLSRPMRAFLINVFVYMSGLHLSGPLFILHYVNNLNVSDGLISLNSAAGTLAYVIGLLIWEKIIARRGFVGSIRVATLLTWIFPCTVALTGNFTLVILANILVNLIHPGVDLSMINVVFKMCAAEHRNMIMSYYTVVLSMAAFVLPLVSIPIAEVIGIPAVMLLSALLRLVGGVMFNLNKVQEAQPQPALQGV
jgi:hypothetical protein